MFSCSFGKGWPLAEESCKRSGTSHLLKLKFVGFDEVGVLFESTSIVEFEHPSLGGEPISCYTIHSIAFSKAGYFEVRMYLFFLRRQSIDYCGGYLKRYG